MVKFFIFLLMPHSLLIELEKILVNGKITALINIFTRSALDPIGCNPFLPL